MREKEREREGKREGGGESENTQSHSFARMPNSIKINGFNEKRKIKSRTHMVDRMEKANKRQSV